MQLIAENNKVSSCVIAGYLEHNIENLLNLMEDEYPIITISFGYKAGTV